MIQIKGNEFPTLLVWGVTAVLVTAAIGMWQRKKKRQDRIPTSWHEVGELVELALFPMKSGKSIFLTEAECTEQGLQTINDFPFQLRDRVFIVYDERNGEFKTARTFPKMVLINLIPCGEDMVKLSAPNMPDLNVKLPDGSDSKKNLDCSLWRSQTVGTADCGDEAAEWLSKYILGKDRGVRLGFHVLGKMSRRPVYKQHRQFLKKFEDKDTGVYQDFTSFMLMSESSVADLDSKAPSDVSVGARQFRPNFLIRGPKAFEEEMWDWIKIGETAVFRNVKICTRCVFTTIDPETGILHPKQQPLRTLREYRKPPLPEMGDTSPPLGVHLGLRAHGIVKVGDKVFIGRE